MNTITLILRKPRNLLVAAALMRQAGRHRRSGGAARQHAERALRAELKQVQPTR